MVPPGSYRRRATPLLPSPRRVLLGRRGLAASASALGLASMVGLTSMLGMTACDRKGADASKVDAAQESAERAAKPQEKDSEAPAAQDATLLLDAQVLDVVNPERRPPYAGPTGSVKGRVVMTGDGPVELPDVIGQIPAKCAEAREMFGLAYRQGMERRLADVLVAVTGYQGYVPPSAEAVTVEARGCAWSTRTVAMMYGQRIDVVSKDKNTYVPELLGQPWPVQLIATPGGDPVFVQPREVGHYVLLDSQRLFNGADVYVLAYPTVAVTGLDGTFEIDRIPPGKVAVNVLLPMTGATAEREVTVEAGKTATVDFELSFDQVEFDKRAAERAAERAERETKQAKP